MNIHNYNDKELIAKSYDEWVKHSPLAQDSKVRKDLKEALTNYREHTLCRSQARDLKKYWEGTLYYEQMLRDKQITDYLVTGLGYEPGEGTSIWSDWEEYCHAIQQA